MNQLYLNHNQPEEPESIKSDSDKEENNLQDRTNSAVLPIPKLLDLESSDTEKNSSVIEQKPITMTDESKPISMTAKGHTKEILHVIPEFDGKFNELLLQSN